MLGRKVAHLDYEDGFALGCIDGVDENGEEDIDVWVFKPNENGVLERIQESGNYQVWDATADDFEIDNWVVVINITVEHILKLDFKYDKITDLYKKGSKFIKLEPHDNYINVYFTYEGNYNWKEKIRINYVHEFIYHAAKAGFKFKIDISKECLEDYLNN